MTTTRAQKKYIPTGTFSVVRNSELILEARLGSSVGIGICDKRNGVSGLYHLLLPRPVGTGSNSEPENYASTGLPLFLRELEKAGARRNGMMATVAGGALVGPVTLTELQMDIGGQTTRIVEQFLLSNGIAIERSETGGYFSCLLRLIARDKRCEISPLGYDAPPSRFSDTVLSHDQIDHAIAVVRPIPQIAINIVRMIHSSEYRMKDISDEVRRDQVISAKVLKICNSALFSPKRKIESIDQALIMLGEKTIIQLVVSTSIELFFQDAGQGYSLCKGGLYHHAIGTALAAEKIAEFTSRTSPDIAYTAGLLHDIGKAVLDQYVAGVTPLFYRRVHVEECELIEAEARTLGTTHTETGGRLAELWSLPEILTEAIRHHHDPSKATLDPNLTTTIYIADLLMSRFSAGLEVERVSTNGLSACLKRLGLRPNQLTAVIASIPWRKIGGAMEPSHN